MMKILSVSSSSPSRWFCLCLTLVLAGCGKGGGFDGATAPYGPRTRSTQVHSTLTLAPGSIFTDTNVSQVTAVVGEKTIGGASYDRLATTRVDDPSKGGEYWIKENSDQTLDFAGFRHTSLLGGIMPAASLTFTTPIKVNLEPPVNQPQAVTTSGTLTLSETSATSGANVTGQYALTEKGATVNTGVGPLSGCNHYTGQAASDSAGIPAIFRGQSINAELWYHPSFGVVAFNAPKIGIGTVMTDTSDCGSVDSSGYRIIRKVGVVDSSSSFKLDTYDCDGNQLAADKNTHASMLLELRWVDETQATTDSEPRPNVEFGVASGGYFANTMTESPASIFHPEENGKGFKYWYSYVSQADKNEPVDSTAYHIKVGAVPGLSPVRVTARIYYKVLPSLVGALPDGGPNYGSRADSGLADGNRADSALADGSRADGGLADGNRADSGPADGSRADSALADSSLTDSGLANAGRDGDNDQITDGSQNDADAKADATDGRVADSPADFNVQDTSGSDARTDAQGSNGETGVFAVPSGSPQSTETFDTPTSTTWVPIQAAGGDYARFASVHDGELVVDVPAGNSWGKTGVRSKDPVFTISDDMASNPYSVVLDFDSALTSGYVVALSPTVNDDIWTAQTVWAAFIHHPTAGGAYASLSNSQSTTDVAKTLANVPLAAPDSVAVTVRPAQAQFCSSIGWGLEGNFAWLTTGTPVYAYVFCHPYDQGLPTRMAVKEIRVLRGGACGPAQAIPAYTALPQEDVFSDAFATGTATNWAPIQAAGGNFTSFAKTTTGELFVDVPAGNSWGKTGIRSNFFFFDVRDDFATTPLSLTFAFDPLRTSGYAIVLSPTVYDDIWTASNVWTAFVRHPTAGGATASLTNTQNANDSSASLTNIPSQAPQTTTVSVRTNHVQVCTPAGWGMEGDYSWMVPGAKVYAYVFSHPFDEGMPSQVALRSVTAQRTAACGASGSIAPFPAPAVRTLFTDNFSTGYATNWTSIQAAGGDFAKFAKNTTGEVYVDVPAGNSWGKTGIRSSHYLFDVRNDYQTAPLQLKFTFDPARTKGYRVVLSTTVYDDIWTAQNVWTGYIYDSVANTGSFDLSNSQNTSDTSTSRTDLPTIAPATFTLTVGVQHVKAEQAGGYVLEGNFAWLTSGQKVYAYVFSHPALEGAASSFALQSVEAKR